MTAGDVERMEAAIVRPDRGLFGDPAARLAPGVDDAARGAFLRWMSFVASAIYAHYWLKDDPARLVPGAEAAAAIEAGLNARIAACWGVMERGLSPGRYLLGDELSVLDLYVAVVSRFRPRRRSIRARCYCASAFKDACRPKKNAPPTWCS